MATRADVASWLANGAAVDKANLRALFLERVEDPWTSVASAATVDLGAVASSLVVITGTTTITSFGTAREGVERTILFASNLTLVHNGTTLSLPGGVSIAAAAGDRCRAISLGGGNWVVVDYSPATQAHGRTLLNVPALPNGVSGAGHWLSIFSGPGNPLVLPLGGTWAYFAFRVNDGGLLDGNYATSVAAGGTIVGSGLSGRAWVALGWRIA